MPDILEKLNLRSEEVQEILTSVPNWMVRWGNVVLLTLLIILLLLSWFIKYPNIITSEAIITTSNPPQKIFANVTEHVKKLLVSNNEFVQKGQLLAVLESPANNKDVAFLKSILDTISHKATSLSFPLDEVSTLKLGDIQTEFAEFQNRYLEFKLSKKYGSSSVDIDEILKNKLIQSFNSLKSSVSTWESNYLFRSDIEGRVIYANTLKENQLVTGGEVLMTVIPTNISFIGRLKSQGQVSNKIKSGQKVYFKLKNYPETDFGIIEGEVNNISKIADVNGLYDVDVILNDKLLTSSGYEINFIENLSSTAEIVTDELRLFERFFYQFKQRLNR